MSQQAITTWELFTTLLDNAMIQKRYHEKRRIIVEKIFREDLDDVAAIYNNLGSAYQAIQYN